MVAVLPRKDMRVHRDVVTVSPRWLPPLPGYRREPGAWYLRYQAPILMPWLRGVRNGRQGM
jgi:hypothetical protein